MKTPPRKMTIPEVLTAHGCRDSVEYFPNLINAIEYYSNQFKPKRKMMNTQIEKIKEYVCSVLDIDPDVVFNNTRKAEIVEARQLIATLYKYGLRMSHTTAGANVGGKDHATVLHSISKVHERYETYPGYRNTVNDIISHLFTMKSDQQYITDRIIDPHKDRRNVLAKFTPQTA